MEELDFIVADSFPNKRERIEYPKDKTVEEIWEEDQCVKNIEAEFFRKGLVNKCILQNYQYSGPDKMYEKTILYIAKKNTKGAVLNLSSLGRSQTMQKDYSIYLIGTKKFKEDMREVLKKHMNLPKPL